MNTRADVYYLAILSFASPGKHILSRGRSKQVLARKLHHFSSLCLVCAAALAAPGLRAQSGAPPFVYSANNSADYSTTIARGSLFVVFGADLGPANLMQFSTFPLPNVLYGTSVTVTSGSTTLNCPIVYTSSYQVAAVLPSNTPVGLAEVAVTYNGIEGTIAPSAPAMVVQSSVGIYTTTESGWGSGVFTAPDGSVITFANSAKPGEIVTAWATGLGPINTPDNVLPTSFPNFPNVEVWVGGQSAPVVSAARSGCCAGVDQVSFTMPAAVADGCNIPVTVVSGGNSSNVTSMAVSASGAACADTGPTLPTTLLTKASAGQPVKVAAIVIGPTTIANPTGFGQSAFDQTESKQKAAAERLSAVLHTHVSEADAAKLMRAYAANNPLGMRTALAKYAPRWKALDTQTKTRLIAQISSLSQEGASTGFASFGSEGILATIASAQLPVPGTCVMLPSGVPHGLGAVSTGLDAGVSLSLVGVPGSFTLKATSKGWYQVSFGSSITGRSIPLGPYTISGSGGKDVGAFSATITVASHPAISNKPSLATVIRTQPLTVTWTGGVAGNEVLIGGYTPGSTAANGLYTPKVYFACAQDGGAGTFTIPSYILSSLNAASGTLWISPDPLSNQITIPDIDFAYFTDGSSDSVNATFK